MDNEKIQEIKKALEVWGNKGIGYFDNNDVFHSVKHNEILDYINELENKIEQRKIIELPCTIGDIVYVINRNNKIEKVTVLDYTVNKNGFIFEVVVEDILSKYYLFDFDFNKDWFLTKAEAEKKIKRIRYEKYC